MGPVPQSVNDRHGFGSVTDDQNLPAYCARGVLKRARAARDSALSQSSHRTRGRTRGPARSGAVPQRGLRTCSERRVEPIGQSSSFPGSCGGTFSGTWGASCGGTLTLRRNSAATLRRPRDRARPLRMRWNRRKRAGGRVQPGRGSRSRCMEKVVRKVLSLPPPTRISRPIQRNF